MIEGRVFVIAGPSGAGKGTVTRRALELLGEEAGRFHFSVSVTTRTKKDGDVEGRDYHFVGSDVFSEMVEGGKLLEWEEVFGYRYGTLRSEVEGFIQRGESVILELDVKGAVNVKAAMPPSLLIFIMPPSIEDLRARLLSRGRDAGEEVAGRLEEAPREMAEAGRFDVVIINEDVEKAAEELARILGGEAG